MNSRFNHIALVFSILVFSLTGNAEILTLKTSKNSSLKMTILVLDGFHVNSECFENKKKCLSLISFNKKNKDEKNLPHKYKLLGNPASDFCEMQNGKSEILQDDKNNEYDYCVLENKYYVDSWDFYKLNKK